MQLGVEFADLTAVSIPVELASYVPKNIVKKFCVVPVKLVKDTLYLAMSDPLDFIAQAEVKVASRKRVIPMIATRRTTEHDISLLYGSEGTAGVIEEMKRVIFESLESCRHQRITDWAGIKSKVRTNLTGYLYKTTKRSPMILPVIAEI